MVTTAKTIRKDSNLVSLVFGLVSCVLCFAQLTNTAAAATYYVDAAGGNDGNPGTSALPWKTMSKAESTVANGDSVFLRSGNYGKVYINSTGLSRTSWSEGVKYIAESGNRPVFTYLSISSAEDRYLEFNDIDIEVNNLSGSSCVQISDSSHIRLYGMNLRGYWAPAQHNDAGVSPHGLLVKNSTIKIIDDIVIQDCNITDISEGITVSCRVGTGFVIKNNIIHHFGSTGIGVSAGGNGTPLSAILIDKNRIYNKEVLVDKLLISGDRIGTFTVNDQITQIVSSGMATGYVSAVETTVSIHPTSQLYAFDFSDNANDIIDTSSGARISNPTLSSYTAAHGSGISIRCHNVTISNNIIRDCGPTRGIMTYGSVFPVDGFHDITIENNLVYDITNDLAVELMDIGDNFIFNNNTIIGFNNDIGQTQSMKHKGALTLRPASSKNGSGFSMYNNVLVGTMSISPGFTDYTENNNIIWSVHDYTYGASPPTWRTSLKGNHTVILAYDNTAANPNYFERSENFFVGGTLFDTYNGNRQSKVLSPYGGIYLNRPHGQDLSDSYKLAANSQAIGFADAAHAPISDILGRTRSFPPDAGCYEYLGSAPSPSPSNNLPNADAGPDQTVTDLDENGSEDVNLNGNGSTDPDGSIVRYEWSKYINGIRTVIAYDVSPTATVSLTPGKHNIELTVTDDSGDTDTDTVTILIELEAGLRKYFKFNEGSGTIASDSTGISDAGRLINGPTWTTQREISFDGNNDAVEITTTDLNVNAGTITLWAYPDAFSKSRHFLLGHSLSQSNRIQLYCNASGSLNLGLGDNTALNSNIQNLNAREWYHIALAWDQGNYKVYVDGTQKAAGAYSGLSSLQTYLDIGNSGSRSSRTEGFDGVIDEVRFYNRSLAADEIADMALAFLPIGDKTTAEGEELSFSIRTKSSFLMDITDNNLPTTPYFASNIFRWTPGYNDAGTYDVEFATEHDGTEDFEKITVTVLDTQQEEPVGYWRFDDITGDTAYDSSGNGNTGYLLNGLTWDSGVFNGSLAFSVPNDAVEIQTSGFNALTGTIAMWVYVEKQTLSRHYLFGHANESLQNRIQLYLKYGNLCLGLGDSHDTAKNIQQLQNQRWYHIALTWNQTAYRLYVDGTSKALGTYSGLTGFADHADIGNNGIYRDKALNGKIDDVLIYNRPLNADEIVQLVN